VHEDLRWRVEDVCRRLELVGEERNNELGGNTVFGERQSGRRLCSGSTRFTNERRGKRGDRVGTQGKATRPRGQVDRLHARGIAASARGSAWPCRTRRQVTATLLGVAYGA
jgi:hypothetical protein